ncbi:hypothetical protein EAS62_20000 [Bradyrhizobium zhanjiangense]|uniref:Uncharacterized protein n=1 Tax=Bradyrhizobium zhanjiangense TaxID=1325107 RepID=A0ABY0DK55_9BRAD|nr:hypothetical protein EAS62_20000 [Bradyrhizobium zhanjiangense]
MTMLMQSRTLPPHVVLAKARTHYPGQHCRSTIRPKRSQQRSAVVMGHGFRQDDTGDGDAVANVSARFENTTVIVSNAD